MKKVFQLMAILAVVGLVSAAFAVDDPAPAKPKPLVRGKITKVEGANVTVQPRGQDAQPVVVKTNDDTKVKIDGDDKKVADLKEGLFVQVFGDEGQPAKQIVAMSKRPGGGGGAPPAGN